ncbi:MAG: nucleotide pyrophosphohydrolase [Dehalococcoidia bacterium]|nr:nucleotide pyrophosphohydrolase [Dehalococcoidia bacterium]
MNELSDTTTTILRLKKRVQKFVEDREWGKYHNSKDLAISITIEASELLELFQWIREKDLEELLKDADKFTRLEEELADIIILCFNLANTTDIDISRAVMKKMEKNEAKYPVELVKGNYKKYTKLRDDIAS